MKEEFKGMGWTKKGLLDPLLTGHFFDSYPPVDIQTKPVFPLQALF